jgi:AbrB family looped-hinge helix DNA binding protein
MNFHSITRRSSLTTKCQVTIPKEIRDALGLKAGDLVDFALDDEGRATIAPASCDEQFEARKAQVLKRVMEARKFFKAHGSIPDGMTNTEWFELMRGPPAEV